MFAFIDRKVNAIVAKEVERRKKETQDLILEEEKLLRQQYNLKVKELDTLKTEVENQVSELKRLRENAITEQKRLWERLDILRDNLNNEQVWIKLWECAFSKAADVTWDIYKKETLHFIEIAKKESFEQGKIEIQKIYENRISDMVKESKDVVNIPLLLKRKDESMSLFLQHQRIKDTDKESYYKGQVDLIGEVLNGKH